jgi:TonB family protein
MFAVRAMIQRVLFIVAASLLLTACSTSEKIQAPIGQVPAAEPRLYNLAEVKIQPVATFQSPPQYPEALRLAGVNGVAVIDFIVGIDGHVEEAKVFKTTNARLGEAALDAVRAWRFRPGIMDNVPVRTHLQVPVVFSSNGGNSDRLPVLAANVHVTPGERIYALTAVTKQPLARTQAPPVYPAQLRESGVEGQAIIGFVINPSGVPADVTVLKATHPILGEAARVAVQQWRFSPAMLNGEAVNCQMQVPIVFQLHNENW